MPACHIVPFVQPGIVIDTTDPDTRTTVTAETCDYCGSVRLEWRKCKLICSDCRQINKSCADL